MFPIGEAAKRSGVAIETIRYYEREGVIPSPKRTSSGRRVYATRDIAQLRFVKRCRDLGFPVRDSKSLLALTDGSHSNCTLAGSIAQNHLDEVKAKIKSLRRMELILVQMTNLCSDNAEKCPVLDQLLAD